MEKYSLNAFQNDLRTLANTIKEGGTLSEKTLDDALRCLLVQHKKGVDSFDRCGIETVELDFDFESLRGFAQHEIYVEELDELIKDAVRYAYSEAS
jgi:hypothetical protein